MNIRLRIAAAFLAAVIVALPASPASAGAASGFGDVSDDAFYADAVAWMVSNQITVGVEPGCFEPSDRVSRGQVATFLFRLDRALGNNPVAGPNPFDDVDTDAFYADAVAWMAAARITTGTSARTFAPDVPVTRGDFATLLWRYAGEPSAPVVHQFTDVTLDYQQAAVSWMADSSITTGTTATTFSPDDFVNRAQAAAFMFRYADPSSATNPPATPGVCTRGVRRALVAGGLTPTEAVCAAPRLLTFSVDYLVEVAQRRAAPSTELLDAVSAISDTGCLTPERIIELVQRYF